MSDEIDSGIIRAEGSGKVIPPERIRPTIRATPPPLPRAEAAASINPSVGENSAANFTAGWLVILAGPGRGRSLALGPGMNQIGQAAGNRLMLNFGDEEISAKAHTTVTYDPRGKKFYVQPGPDAVHLTYLGEEGNAQPVLTPTEITGNEVITLGKTRLKFVPFCGPGFSWD